MENLSKKIWRKYLRGNIERNQKKLLGVSESSSVIVGGILEIIISNWNDHFCLKINIELVDDFRLRFCLFNIVCGSQDSCIG